MSQIAFQTSVLTSDRWLAGQWRSTVWIAEQVYRKGQVTLAALSYREENDRTNCGQKMEIQTVLLIEITKPNG